MELSTTDLQVIGPGDVEVGDGSLAQYPLTISQPGIHRLVVQATDFDARLYTDQVAVLVYDPDQLDALLQAKWNNMKSRLADGDIEGALQDFDPNARPLYEYNFNALQDHLGEVLAGVQQVTLVKASEDRADYELIGVQGGESFSFLLVFKKGADGIWHIRFF